MQLRPAPTIVTTFLAGLLAACASTTPPPQDPGARASAAAAPAPGPEDAYARLAPEDVALAAATMQKALESSPDGERLGWKNGATGRSGGITPLRTYVTAGGYYCRTYQEELRGADGADRFRHEACRNEDGAWVWL